MSVEYPAYYAPDFLAHPFLRTIRIHKNTFESAMPANLLNLSEPSCNMREIFIEENCSFTGFELRHFLATGAAYQE